MVKDNKVWSRLIVRTLFLHSNYIEVEAISPAKGAKGIIEEIDESRKRFRVEEPLVVFIALEGERGDLEKLLENTVYNIEDVAKKVGLKSNNIVLYPYVHLTQNPSKPELAFNFLKNLEEKLKEKGFNVYRAPFGWYKRFNIDVKGHPLAELSRVIDDKEIKKEEDKVKKIEEKKEKTHIDFADELDLIVKHERQINFLGKRFGDLIGKGIQLFSLAGGLYRKILFNILEDFHIKRGYYVVETPMIANSELYNVSGHLKFYRENMYIFKIEDHEFAIKPMNCPHHILITINLLEKFRRIPIPFRVFELGRVHRYEPSGSVYGLLRVRGFTQDDAHIFAKPEQIEKEMLKVFEEMKEIYESIFRIKISGESIKLRLSFYDPKELGKYYAGSREEWEEVQEFMRKVADKLNKKYGIEYFEGIGEAVFYGPKLDFVAKFEDIGEWQVGTIQFDFNLPRRFKLNEIIKEIMNVEQIYMIHRALLGSIERFLGVYLEFRKGRLPFVLNPIQVAIIKIKTGNEEVDRKIDEKANEIYNELKEEKIRVVRIDSSKTEINNTFRLLESRLKPSVYVFIGKKEVEKDFLTVKYYSLEEKKHKVDRDLFKVIENLEKDVEKLNNKKYRVFEDLEFFI